MIWNKQRLKSLVEEKLSDYQIILVSNREPYMHIYRGGEVEVIMPASGMAIALDSLMQACGGTWIAAGSGEADQEAVAGLDAVMVPPQDPKYKLRRVWLTKQEERDYYYGFSNEALWPLCHIAYTRPRFDTGQWETYQAVNRKFADAILSEVGDRRTIVFIQDYHFALLPRMLKEADPRLVVCQFWHIPWPNFEVFRICPWAGRSWTASWAMICWAFTCNTTATTFSTPWTGPWKPGLIWKNLPSSVIARKPGCGPFPSVSILSGLNPWLIRPRCPPRWPRCVTASIYTVSR